MTVIAFLQGWFDGKAAESQSRGTVKSSTIARYKSYVGNFVAYLRDTGLEALALKNLTAGHLAHFNKFFSCKSWTPKGACDFFASDSAKKVVSDRRRSTLSQPKNLLKCAKLIIWR